MRTPQRFGAWVRDRRLELGLTQTELATLSGVSESSIRRIERGNAAASFGNVEAIVEALGGEFTVGDSSAPDSSEAEDSSPPARRVG